MAHRDNDGRGPGANDNASGIAALVQLAQLVRLARRQARPCGPQHTLVFLVHRRRRLRGARRAAVRRDAQRPRGRRDRPGRRSQDTDRLGMVLAGDSSRDSPLASLVETAAQRVLEQTGQRPAHAERTLAARRPRASRSRCTSRRRCSAHGIPALTLTSGGERPPARVLRPAGSPRRRSPRPARPVGPAAPALARLRRRARARDGELRLLRPADVPGWAIELVLIAMLLPSWSSAVDLFARCRRRHIPLTPALRSYRSRSCSGSGSAVLFELFALARLLAERRRPCRSPPDATPATTGPWSALDRARRPAPGSAGWSRGSGSLRGGPVSATEELAGHDRGAARARPSSRCSSWRRTRSRSSSSCPRCTPGCGCRRCAGRPLWTRAGGPRPQDSSGPLLLFGSLAIRYGLGLDAPWYVAELTATRLRDVCRRSRSRSAGWPRPASSTALVARPLRAVPERARAAAARAAAGSGPANRAYSECSASSTSERGAPSTRRLTLRRFARIPGTLLAIAGVAVLVWVRRRLALAGPVHCALHAPGGSTSSRTGYKRRRPRRTRRRPVKSGASLAATTVQIRAQARRYRLNSKRGARHRPHPRPAARAEHDLRQGHRRCVAQERPRPRPADVHAGRRAARLHRRPPHDVPRAVRPHRAPPSRRRRDPRGAVRDVHVPRLQAPDRPGERPRRSSAPTATRSSSSRPAIRGSSPRTATSPTHAWCGSSPRGAPLSSRPPQRWRPRRSLAQGERPQRSLR